MFENMVLRQTFGPSGDEVAADGEWAKAEFCEGLGKVADVHVRTTNERYTEAEQLQRSKCPFP